MGVITTNIVIDPIIFGYSTLEGATIDKSNAPRGEVVYAGKNLVITEGDTGDSQIVNLNLTLPQNFAYTLTDFYIHIQSATDMADWDTHGSVVMNERRLGPANYNIKQNAESTGVSTFTSSGLVARTYALPRYPKGLFRPSQEEQVAANFSFNLSNKVLDGEAASMTAFVRFIQYDVSQQHGVAVNVPTLTR